MFGTKAFNIHGYTLSAGPPRYVLVLPDSDMLTYLRGPPGQGTRGPFRYSTKPSHLPMGMETKHKYRAHVLWGMHGEMEGFVPERSPVY